MQPYCRQDRTQARRILCLIRRAVERTPQGRLVVIHFKLPRRLPDKRKCH